jgi:hypothetical protein
MDRLGRRTSWCEKYFTIWLISLPCTSNNRTENIFSYDHFVSRIYLARLCTPICSSNRKPQIVPLYRIRQQSESYIPIDPKLWWIMPAFDLSNITFVLLWLRCGLPPTPVVMTSRHDATRNNVTTLWRHTSTLDRFKYDVIQWFCSKIHQQCAKNIE